MEEKVTLVTNYTIQKFKTISLVNCNIKLALSSNLFNSKTYKKVIRKWYPSNGKGYIEKDYIKTENFPQYNIKQRKVGSLVSFFNTLDLLCKRCYYIYIVHIYIYIDIYLSIYLSVYIYWLTIQK